MAKRKKKEAEAAKAATLNTGTNDGKKSTDYLYVVPVMTLRQGNSANLVLNIDVNEKAKSFKYE